jgi:hypothetical protein
LYQVKRGTRAESVLEATEGRGEYSDLRERKRQLACRQHISIKGNNFYSSHKSLQNNMMKKVDRDEVSKEIEQCTLIHG